MGIEQCLTTDSDKVTLTFLQDFLRLFRLRDQAYTHRPDPGPLPDLARQVHLVPGNAPGSGRWV